MDRVFDLLGLSSRSRATRYRVLKRFGLRPKDIRAFSRTDGDKDLAKLLKAEITPNPEGLVRDRTKVLVPPGTDPKTFFENLR